MNFNKNLADKILKLIINLTAYAGVVFMAYQIFIG